MLAIAKYHRLPLHYHRLQWRSAHQRSFAVALSVLLTVWQSASSPAPVSSPAPTGKRGSGPTAGVVPYACERQLFTCSWEAQAHEGVNERPLLRHSLLFAGDPTLRTFRDITLNVDLCVVPASPCAHLLLSNALPSAAAAAASPKIPARLARRVRSAWLTVIAVILVSAAICSHRAGLCRGHIFLV